MLIAILIFAISLLTVFSLVCYFMTPARIRVGDFRAFVPLVGGMWIYYRWQKDLRGRV
jgi:hypothetical protein